MAHPRQGENVWWHQAIVVLVPTSHRLSLRVNSSPIPMRALPSLVPRSTARPAEPTTVCRSTGVDLGPGVPNGARLGQAPAQPAARVLLVRHGLEVRGVAAGPIATEVVDHQVAWIADGNSVGCSVSRGVFPVEVEHTVSARQGCGPPRPAFVWAATIDLGPESVRPLDLRVLAHQSPSARYSMTSPSLNSVHTRAGGSSLPSM